MIRKQLLRMFCSGLLLLLLGKSDRYSYQYQVQQLIVWAAAVSASLSCAGLAGSVVVYCVLCTGKESDGYHVVGGSSYSLVPSLSSSD